MMIMDPRLKEKHLVIWGIGILQSDLEGIYEFPNLLYYIDDHVSEKNMISVSLDKVYSSEKLAYENCESMFVILCTEEQEEAISRLKDMGFREDQYMLGEELLVHNSLYSQICACDIAVWGTGTTYSFYEDKINRYLPEVSHFIVTEKEEEYFQRKKVLSLEEMKTEDRDSYIVIASIYYKEIYKSLIRLGKVPGRDFIHIDTLMAVCSLAVGVDEDCRFEDRKKNSADLLIVLAGYKKFVWESVFQRLKAFVPEQIDVCVVTSGLVDTQLKDMCKKNDWSYMSTSKNNVSLAVNTVIWKHPQAKFIYKMDEDIFLTEGIFGTLKDTYLVAEEKGRYEVGFVSPLIPINGYGHVRLLEIFDGVKLWEKQFGKLKYTDNLTHHKSIWGNPEAAMFMWGEGNPKMRSLDEMQTILSKREFQYSVCPMRYSIGFILFHRDNWIRMGGFPVMVGNMGMDEEALCRFCMMQSRAMVISENAVAGHLSFGPQNKKMEQYYHNHKEQFSLSQNKDYYYADDIVERLNHASQLIVFGAGNVAYLVVHCLKNRPYNFSIKYCLVSERIENSSEVDGVPVVDYQDAEGRIQKDALILIAVVEKHLASVKNSLRNHGFFNLLPFTFESDLWSLLRGNIYRNCRLLTNKPYLVIEEELEKVKVCREQNRKTIHIYQACCHVDRKLKEDISRFSWEIPIQVGATLTEKRVCEIRDNTGEHISYKNGQYCELTALYWIWKNDKADYVGLGHYRRHFELDEEQLEKISCSDIDVVLTIPIMDLPSVKSVYCRDHVGSDWKVMMEAIENLSPEYMETALEVGNGKFYYAYNMFIMRRDILEKYCGWLFPILAYCEEHCMKKQDTYQNRYIGFLAEHLMSIYFQKHEAEYKIVHARKHFVEE